MKIEFLTQDDPLYILPFFEEFLRHYNSRFEIAQISYSRTMGKRSRKKLFGELIDLYGLFGFVRLATRLAFSRILGSLPRGKDASTYRTMSQLCKAYGIKYVPVENPNSLEFVEAVTARKADALVSVACPHILRDQLLKLPPLGCVNLHHAPLPRYKGMMPTFWQMFHGERHVGVTVHCMVPKVDEGQALLQESLEIQPGGESLDNLIRRSKRHGAHCMAKVLEQLQSGSARPIPLDNGKGTYFTFPTRDEIREFHRRGFRAI